MLQNVYVYIKIQFIKYTILLENNFNKTEICA